MDNYIIYLRCDNPKAVVVDKYNGSKNVVAPQVVRGTQARLRIRPLKNGLPMTAAQLSEYVSWDFVLANDWLTTTPVQVRANIDPEVGEIISVTSTVEDGVTYGEILVPLLNINSNELIAVMGNNESMALGAELLGFEPGNDKATFIAQYGMSVRGRRSDAGTGTPEPVGDGTYSAVQVNALLAAKPDLAGVPVNLPAADTTDVIIGTASRYLLDVLIKDTSGHWWNHLCYLTSDGTTAYLTPMIGDASPVALSNFDPATGLDGSLVDGALVLSVTLSAGNDLTLTYNVITEN